MLGSATSGFLIIPLYDWFTLPVEELVLTHSPKPEPSLTTMKKRKTNCGLTNFQEETIKIFYLRVENKPENVII